MPSSLVVTALIVAWLAVLVPVVARRRQLVPRPAEADLSSRVLRRAGGPASMEVAVPTTTSSVRSSGAVIDRDRDARSVADDVRDAELRDDELRDDELRDDDLRDDDLRDDDLRDEGDGLDDAPADDRPWEEAPARTPRAYRPGRGGFDPEAALAAADARYAFRRRVAVGLLVAAVVTALAALVISSAMWWLHVAVDLSLVGYLVFLRRQTRLEEEVRERRLARARGDRRALEARREWRRAEAEADAQRWGAWEGDPDLDEDDATDDRAPRDDRADEFDDVADDELLEIDEHPDDVVVAADASPRRSFRRTPDRRAPHGALPEGLELVEDTDDDPAFHDLDADRLPAYRRAAGA